MFIPHSGYIESKFCSTLCMVHHVASLVVSGICSKPSWGESLQSFEGNHYTTSSILLRIKLQLIISSWDPSQISATGDTSTHDQNHIVILKGQHTFCVLYFSLLWAGYRWENHAFVSRLSCLYIMEKCAATRNYCSEMVTCPTITISSA